MSSVPLSSLADISRCQVKRLPNPALEGTPWVGDNGETWEEQLQKAELESSWNTGMIVNEAGFYEIESGAIRTLTRNLTRRVVAQFTQKTRNYFLRQWDILLPCIGTNGTLNRPAICLYDPPSTIPGKNFFLCRAKEGTLPAWLYFALSPRWNLENYAAALTADETERAGALQNLRSESVVSLKMTAARDLLIPEPLSYEEEFAKKAMDFFVRTERKGAQIMADLRTVFGLRDRLTALDND